MAPTLKSDKNLLERILDRDNLNTAFRKVKKNGGAPGIDNMRVEELYGYLKGNGVALRKLLLAGNYKPNPVKRVEIPKSNGGKRALGIPTVIDRVIQQAIHQVLTWIFEEKFSDNSYGFRPGRSAQQAVLKAQDYQNAGNRIVVDIDLEKFFDQVNHDKLVYLLSKEISDKRVLKLIRLYLKAGVMDNGLVSPSSEGTPQGGPLSPLLSNVMLHELDTELERRGHKFCRYADDCNIFVGSERAGQRVMQSITKFIEDKLYLKVNGLKSAVAQSDTRKFLGFSFYLKDGETRIIVHPKSLEQIRNKLKELTRRSRSWNNAHRSRRINEAVTGWVNYFKIADMKGTCSKLDAWMRRRFRMCIWKQWKRVRTRYRKLIILGISHHKAYVFANTRKGCWRISKSPILGVTLTNNHLKNEYGLKGFLTVYKAYTS
jgi:RNA-directed DNA polymerase